MIVYHEDFQKASISNFSSVVDKTWTQLSGSSVWLEQYGVFLTVSRVMFHNDKSLFHPIISFIRAQIYDTEWNHLDQHTITWKDKIIMFPLVYDVGLDDFEKGGKFYGPEDPRVIIEEGVIDAEPVIVFNMIGAKSDWKRAMWIFRPFSGHTAILSIRGQ